MSARNDAFPHKVEAVPASGKVPAHFDVTSGNSGNVYTVTPKGGDTADCSCPAGKHGRACSHVKAVIDHVVEAFGRAGRDPGLRTFIEKHAADGNVRCRAALKHIEEADAACRCGAEASGKAHRTDPWCPALDRR